MTLQEKILYHQIHPLKIGTDFSAQVIATVLFWDHLLLVGFLAMLIPPVIASALIIPTLDVTWIKNSAVGRYLKRAMTHTMEAVRLAGTVPIVFGAWFHQPWLIVPGFLIVLFGWLRGLFFQRKAPKDAISSLS